MCAVAGAAAPWGSTIVTLLGTSWLGAGLRLSPSALPAGALWGSGPFPGASYQPSADCWAGRLLHRDFSSWYVGFDFIFQHRFQLNLQHVISIAQLLEAVLVASLLVSLEKEKSNFTFRRAAEACVLTYRKPILIGSGKWL